MREITPMRIAIPASGPTVNDPVDTRFGRAPYFIILSSETGDTETLPNSLAAESGGIGPRIVQVLVQKEVTHLIAPRIGGNAETALSAAKIEVFLYNGTGTVSSALDQFNAGNLPPMTDTSRTS